MPNSVLVTKHLNGPRNVVVHVFLEADGSGDLSDYVVISPTDLDPAGDTVPTFRIVEIIHDLDTFTGVLKFNYLDSDVPIWSMSGNGSASPCFESFGGLPDRAPAMDGNGSVMLDTRGFMTPGQTGSFVLKLRIK